jgi:hypothetical protein
MTRSPSGNYDKNVANSVTGAGGGAWAAVARSVVAAIGLSAVTSCGGGGGGTTPPQPVTPSSLTITGGNNQTGTVGAPLPAVLTVTVSSQADKPVPGVTVNWTVSSGGGSVSQSSVPTRGDGTASVGLTLGTKAGANTVTATSSGLPTARFTATGAPGPLAVILMTNAKNPLAAGDMVQLGASGADSYGNAVSAPSPISWTQTTDSVTPVVTVDASGQLTAIGPGGAVVHASGGGVFGNLPVVVSGNITFSLGAEEVVFRYSTDGCETTDSPDVPPRAVRLADGSLMLVGGGAPRNFVMFGADFSTLKRRCTAPALISDDSPNADTFDNQEWLQTVYRQGSTIHALIHNEYHDPVAPNCLPGNSTPANPCWYNSLTYASSTDGGQTFTHMTPPAHVIAPPAVRWDPGPPTPPPHGYFEETNVVLASDGYYYVLFMAIDRTAKQGMCVMRTQTLSDPASWRAWNGTAFNLQMANPYTGPAPAWCTQVIPGGITGSVTYNGYLGTYMLVGDVAAGNNCGVFFFTSPDLVTWTVGGFIRAQYWPSLVRGVGGGCSAPSGIAASANTAIIDHSDITTNLE